MKTPLSAPPDDFSLSPLLALLPKKGDAGKLSLLTTSLYARHEKVAALKKEMGESGDKNAAKKISAEEAMLRQVLEWLELNL